MSKFPPPLTDERMLAYIKDPMLFRMEQWCVEPCKLLPNGGLFGEVCEDWQRDMILKPMDEMLENGDPQYNLLYIQLPKKFGKCLDLLTYLPTPNGYTQMKDIKIGDILFDEKGQPCQVTFVTDTMYDHDCYEITFSDGEKIIADKDHLWLTQALQVGREHLKNTPKSMWKKKSDISLVRTTKEIKETLYLDNPAAKDKKYSNHKIQVCDPIDLPEKDLLIPPYTLGAWLGDGTSDSSTITVHEKDWSLLEEIKKDGIENKRLTYPSIPPDQTPMFSLWSDKKWGKNSLHKKLRKLNVLKNKHIPSDYLRASIKQRLSLLQGLMDTDGYCGKKQGSCEFTTIKEILAEGVFELLISLGFKPVMTRNKSFLNGKRCNDHWRLTFTGFKDKPIFRLKRKLERLKDTPEKKTRASFRHIKSIEKVKSVPVKCIQVDSSSKLFLVSKSMIPTHNTTILSGICIDKLLLSKRPARECYLLGGDKDQARYLFNNTRKFIERNPNFEGIFTILKNEIIVNSTEARLSVLSSEAATKQGLNPDFFIFDEFWNQTDRHLWDTMWLGMAAKSHGQGVIITNAGINDKTICFDIREMARSKKFKSIYYFEPDKPVLQAMNVPWINDEWIEMQRQSLPPNVFRRFILNEWTSGGDAPFMPDEGWDCFKGGMEQKISCKEGNHFLGIDVGIKEDAAAAVLLHREKGRIVVDQMMQWKGSKKVPVPISEIENYIAVVINNFSDVTLVMDPWQAIGTLQKFQRLGVTTVEFNFTVQNVVKLSKNLYYLFRNVAFCIPHFGPLEDELKGLQVVEKSYGWRIDHEVSTSSDLSMGLGMAALKSIELGEEDLGKTGKDLYFLDTSHIYRSTGTRTFDKDPIQDMPEDTPLITSPGKRLF